MNTEEARTILQAHIDKLKGFRESATPGVLRWSMTGYSIKSDLSGTIHDGDYREIIASVSGGPAATQTALRQFSNDAVLLCAGWNSLRAHILAVEVLVKWKCPFLEPCRCTICAALIAVAEALAGGAK